MSKAVVGYSIINAFPKCNSASLQEGSWTEPSIIEFFFTCVFAVLFLFAVLGTVILIIESLFKIYDSILYLIKKGKRKFKKGKRK